MPKGASDFSKKRKLRSVSETKMPMWSNIVGRSFTEHVAVNHRVEVRDLVFVRVFVPHPIINSGIESSGADDFNRSKHKRRFRIHLLLSSSENGILSMCCSRIATSLSSVASSF